MVNKRLSLELSGGRASFARVRNPQHANGRSEVAGHVSRCAPSAREWRTQRTVLRNGLTASPFRSLARHGSSGAPRGRANMSAYHEASRRKHEGRARGRVRAANKASVSSGTSLRGDCELRLPRPARATQSSGSNETQARPRGQEDCGRLERRP